MGVQLVILTLPMLHPCVREPQNHARPHPPTSPVAQPAPNAANINDNGGFLNSTVFSHPHSTRWSDPKNFHRTTILHSNNEESSAFCWQKDWFKDSSWWTTTSLPSFKKAQRVFPAWWDWSLGILPPIEPMVISEHAPERLTPDRRILYIQYEYIYSNFNELLFSYSFNLLYCFILVMRNNIMFCGFSSFLLLNYYYLLYGIYEHTLKYTRLTNSSKQYVLFLHWREGYLTLRCTFLLSHPGNESFFFISILLKINK